jgi:hypothetical protein
MTKFLTPETKLSYADLEHMRLTKRSEQHLQRVVPPWTASREAIQAVVIAKLKRYTRFTGCKKTELEKAGDLLAALDVLARKSQRRIRRFADSPRFASYHVLEHLKSVRTRSLAALWIFEIYSAYRLGWNSVDIAQQLGITPWAVRQHLFRLNQVARVVCPELCAPARDFGGVHSRRRYLEAKIAKAEQLAERTRKKPKLCARYEARLVILRNTKAQQEAECQHATLYKRDRCASKI